MFYMYSIIMLLCYTRYIGYMRTSRRSRTYTLPSSSSSYVNHQHSLCCCWFLALLFDADLGLLPPLP